MDAVGRVEPSAVEAADRVRAVTGPEDPTRVVGIAVNRQLEHVGAIQASGHVETTRFLPLLQVRRREEREPIIAVLPAANRRAGEGDHHDPPVGWRVPENLGIAVVVGNRLDDRILLVFRPRASAVVAVGQADDTILTGVAQVAGAGVEKHDRRLRGLKARRVLLVDHRGPRAGNTILLVRRQARGNSRQCTKSVLTACPQCMRA